MTPLEEAVARIVDPSAWTAPNWVYDGLAERRKDSLEKARRILALPEIVKMQEVLEQAIELCEVAIDWNLDEAEIGGVMTATHTLKDNFHVALQPLKKEAE